MRNNPRDNFLIDMSLDAVSRAAAAYEGAAVDHSLYPYATYIVSAGTIGSSGTVDAKLQFSADGSTSWTDDAGATGNLKAITQITAAGEAFLHVNSPVNRFSRVHLTVGTAACVTSVTVVAGPKRHVAPE